CAHVVCQIHAPHDTPSAGHELVFMLLAELIHLHEAEYGARSVHQGMPRAARCMQAGFADGDRAVVIQPLAISGHRATVAEPIADEVISENGSAHSRTSKRDAHSASNRSPYAFHAA